MVNKNEFFQTSVANKCYQHRKKYFKCAFPPVNSRIIKESMNEKILNWTQGIPIIAENWLENGIKYQFKVAKIKNKCDNGSRIVLLPCLK